MLPGCGPPAGCGGSSGQASRPAPAATEFPSAQGKTIGELLKEPGAKPSRLVIAPAAQVFEVGEARYPFGVFTRGKYKGRADFEPWTFLVDRNGIVRDRIEGAVGVSELETAMRTIAPG